MTRSTLDTVEIPIPAGHGRAFRVGKGQSFELIDVEGQQVGDLCALSAEDPREHVFLPVTRLAIERTDLLHGDALLTNRRRPLLRLDDDPVGTHDTLFGVCDRYRYEVDFGLEAYHRNCRDNFIEALAGEGVGPHEAGLASDNAINVFINQRFDGTRYHLEAPRTKPGDGAIFTAINDAIVAVSACPEELSPCNGGNPTPMLVRVL